ncbi:MAG: toll/interleukin-1 receptor domain-containing protein, partial [Kamptonema sp. SIO4C4]|nr:toll/interleukin-1 receptor domain-containing protein [Kamptonema sp. SIO4C4]
MTAHAPPMSLRDVVFISHANPEDNAFATWLSLRLIREGYRVWCDVVRLKGGDDFWKDIENAIRSHTRRFIYVVSRASNSKPGTLNELSVASGVARQLGESGFIIPVKIDDLPYGEHNIQINRLNAVSFTSGWAEGFAEVLRALRLDNIPTPEDSGPSCVASWWNTNRLNQDILVNKWEPLWTNWFNIHDLPRQMWVWHVSEDERISSAFDYPTYRIGRKLLSFANGPSLTGAKHEPTLATGQSFRLDLRRPPARRTGLSSREVKIAVGHL